MKVEYNAGRNKVNVANCHTKTYSQRKKEKRLSRTRKQKEDVPDEILKELEAAEDTLAVERGI